MDTREYSFSRSALMCTSTPFANGQTAAHSSSTRRRHSDFHLIAQAPLRFAGLRNQFDRILCKAKEVCGRVTAAACLTNSPRDSALLVYERHRSGIKQYPTASPVQLAMLLAPQSPLRETQIYLRHYPCGRIYHRHLCRTQHGPTRHRSLQRGSLHPNLRAIHQTYPHLHSSCLHRQPPRNPCRQRLSRTSCPARQPTLRHKSHVAVSTRRVLSTL